MMNYLRVKEVNFGEYENEQGDLFSIYETESEIINANEADLFVGSSLKEAELHFELKKIGNIKA